MRLSKVGIVLYPSIYRSTRLCVSHYVIVTCIHRHSVGGTCTCMRSIGVSRPRSLHSDNVVQVV